MSCFLCFAPIKRNRRNLKDEDKIKLEIVGIINQHFQFLQEKLLNSEPPNICSECWHIVSSFNKLFKLAQEKHASQIPDLEVKEEPVEKRENPIKSIREKSRPKRKCRKEVPKENEVEEVVKVVEIDALKFEFHEIPKRSCRKEVPGKNYVPKDKDVEDLTEATVEKNDNNLKIKFHEFPEESEKSPSKEFKSEPLKSNSKEIEIGPQPASKDEEMEMRAAEICDMTCQQCPQKFKKFSECKPHYRKDHGISGYIICCKCKFKKRGRFYDHINRHYFPDLFSCELCKNKSFRDRRGLKLHIKTMHTETKEFECQVCQKKVSTANKLKLHMNSHIPKTEMKFKCEFCPDRFFPSKNRLNMHLKLKHDPNRKLEICDVCGKTLKSKYTMEIHLKQHLNDGEEERIHCTICDHWLKSGSSYRNHKRRHDEEGNHACPECSKNFSNLSAMRSHVKYVHKDERKWPCTVCEKAFKKEWNLKEHLAGHTGQTLYECTFCNKSFNSSANMTSHRKKMHPVEWKEQLMPKYLKPN